MEVIVKKQNFSSAEDLTKLSLQDFQFDGIFF